MRRAVVSSYSKKTWKLLDEGHLAHYQSLHPCHRSMDDRSSDRTLALSIASIAAYSSARFKIRPSVRFCISVSWYGYTTLTPTIRSPRFLEGDAGVGIPRPEKVVLNAGWIGPDWVQIKCSPSMVRILRRKPHRASCREISMVMRRSFPIRLKSGWESCVNVEVIN